MEANVESGFNVRKLLVFIAAIIVVLVIGSAASRVVLNRAATNNDAPIFTPDYSLSNIKADDLFVVADSAQLLPGSHVQADAALIGKNNVTVEGLVDGDLTVMGGSIQLGKEALVKGDAVLIGNKVTLSGQINGELNVIADTLTINPDALLKGSLDICATHFINEQNLDVPIHKCGADELAGWQSLRDGSLATKVISGGEFSLSSFIFNGLFAMGLAALSGLIVTIFPRRFGHMTEAIRTLPRRASRIGCLTQIFAVALVLGLGILIAVLPPLGLILLPILALLFIPLGILFVIGWMTMALLAGDWLLRRFAGRSTPPMLTVIAGSMGLFILWTLVGMLPYGPILSLVWAALIGTGGLGAAVMTRVGTRSPSRSYFVQG
ncbi:MAG: hypothetical protein GC179_17285 [Anaerolineaceae bacterium]|nr:hypothetical protein [Anaerolineaceae bacterium]